MSKFTELLRQKSIEILGEAPVPPTAGVQPGQQPGQQPVQPGQQPAQPGQQAQQQAQPTQQQEGPESFLVKALQQMPMKNGQQAAQVLNTAIKNAGNVPGMSEFFTNLGYDPNQGFVYNPQQQAPQQQTTQQQPTQQQTPGATATNSQPAQATTAAANRSR